MRILFCNFEYPPLGGGGGVVTALLAQELSKRHEVTVLTSRSNGLPGESVENGVRVFRVPVFFRREETAANLASMLAFIPEAIHVGKQILKRDEYDIINTHFVLPTGPVGEALAHFAGIPNVLTLHGGDLYDPSKLLSPHRHRLLREWIRRLLKRADVVVGQSTDTLQNMRRIYAPEIVGVRIPLGIRRPEISAAPRERYGCKEDEILLVTIGRLVARKAVSQLVSIMEGFRKRKVRLLIVGTGPQEFLLKKESRKNNLEDQVLFLGQVPESEKFRILQMCDIYVSTSQHEGFGLVFLEAMASKLPIVCYDQGGQTDFLQDRKTGYIVPLNNTELFTKQCDLLIQNPGLCKEIGENNRRKVEEFYIDRCTLLYEGVFDKLTRMKGKVAEKMTLPLKDELPAGEFRPTADEPRDARTT